VSDRRYRLHFDDGHTEDISAPTPSVAVARREGGRMSRLPHTLTDLTSMHAFVRTYRDIVPASKELTVAY
jgi:hypothetical protein